jgi:hypothetical protein
MADIVITDSAHTAILGMMNDLANYEHPTTPCLRVHWFGGASENWRGSGGEAMWRQVQPPGWAASIAGWAEVPGQDLTKYTTQVRGVHVLRDPRAEMAKGTLVVGTAGNELGCVDIQVMQTMAPTRLMNEVNRSASFS